METVPSRQRHRPQRVNDPRFLGRCLAVVNGVHHAARNVLLWKLRQRRCRDWRKQLQEIQEVVAVHDRSGEQERSADTELLAVTRRRLSSAVDYEKTATRALRHACGDAVCRLKELRVFRSAFSIAAQWDFVLRDGAAHSSSVESLDLAQGLVDAAAVDLVLPHPETMVVSLLREVLACGDGQQPWQVWRQDLVLHTVAVHHTQHDHSQDNVDIVATATAAPVSTTSLGEDDPQTHLARDDSSLLQLAGDLLNMEYPLDDRQLLALQC